MTRTVAQKMGIKANSKTILVNSDRNAIDSIELPELEIVGELESDIEYIHLFVKTQTEFVELSQN